MGGVKQYVMRSGIGHRGLGVCAIFDQPDITLSWKRIWAVVLCQSPVSMGMIVDK